MNRDWEVEYTAHFFEWWDALTAAEQESVSDVVELLVELGPRFPFPHSSGIFESRYPHMRELRIQHRGKPYRVLYAFDPRRYAILLLGGKKTDSRRWYTKNIPIADRLYEQHLIDLNRKGSGDDEGK